MNKFSAKTMRETLADLRAGGQKPLAEQYEQRRLANQLKGKLPAGRTTLPTGITSMSGPAVDVPRPVQKPRFGAMFRQHEALAKQLAKKSPYSLVGGYLKRVLGLIGKVRV